MQNGKIVWIAFNDCIYCSEIEKIFAKDDNRFVTILIMNPIIGNVRKLCVAHNISSERWIAALYYTEVGAYRGDFCRVSYDLDVLNEDR